MKHLHLKLIKLLLVSVIWPVSISVAADTVTKITLESALTMEILLVVFLISTLSGATALVVKLDSDLRADNISKNLFVFFTSNIFGSWLAGMVGFLIAKATGVENVWNQLLMICLMAYTGARGLEKISEYRLSKVADMIAPPWMDQKPRVPENVKPTESVKPQVTNEVEEVTLPKLPTEVSGTSVKPKTIYPFGNEKG